jgi:hypothetical protein
MSQHDYVIDNQAGAAFRTDLNSVLAAIVSNNSGAAAPSTTYAYQLWADTTTGLLKIRNAANSGWVTIGDLATAYLGLALASGGTLTNPTISGGSISGITALAIADGGTGQSSAAGAFNAIKQAATSSATGVVELADNTEALAGSDTTRAVTPAGLASSKSYASSGYQKLPGGLIIQWGSIAGSVNVSFTSLLTGTFPIAFPSAVYQVVATVNQEDGADDLFAIWKRSASTLSQVRIMVREIDGVNQSSWDVSYVAIGK